MADISIITAVKNNRTGLEHTLQSLKKQKYRNFEHIIVDAASTDGTIELIKKNERDIGRWESEKDSGYAQAWNKGLRMASAKIIGMLNAGDTYHDDTLATVAENLEPAINTDTMILVYGDAEMVDVDNGACVEYREGLFDERRITQGFGFMHTTCFTTRKVYDAVGFFNEKYAVAADTDFLLRCWKGGVDFRKIPIRMSMETGGLSEKKKWAGMREYYYQLLKVGISPFRVGYGALRYYMYHRYGM